MGITSWSRSVDRSAVSAKLPSVNLQRIKTKLARLNLTKADQAAAAQKAQFRRDDEAMIRAGRRGELLEQKLALLGGTRADRAEVLTVNGVRIKA